MTLPRDRKNETPGTSSKMGNINKGCVFRRVARCRGWRSPWGVGAEVEPVCPGRWLALTSLWEPSGSFSVGCHHHHCLVLSAWHSVLHLGRRIVDHVTLQGAIPMMDWSLCCCRTCWNVCESSLSLVLEPQQELKEGLVEGWSWL